MTLLECCNMFLGNISTKDHNIDTNETLSYFRDNMTCHMTSCNLTNCIDPCENISEDLCYGPKSIEYIMKHYFTQIVLATLAFILNIKEILLLRQKRNKSSLEFLLVSLATADALFSLLVFGNMILYMIDDRHPFIKDVLPILIYEQLLLFSIFVSIFHVLSISFDRLLAVCCPFRYKFISCNKNIRIYMASLWIVTLLLEATMAGYHFRQGLEKGLTDTTTDRIVGAFMFAAGFLLCIFYVILSYKLLQQRKHVRRSSTASNNKIERVAFTCALVISVIFLICTFPMATLYLFPSITCKALKIVAQCFLIANSIFNPIIYFWRGYWIRRNIISNLENNMRRGDGSQYSIASAATTSLETNNGGKQIKSFQLRHSLNYNSQISPGRFQTFNDVSCMYKQTTLV